MLRAVSCMCYILAAIDCVEKEIFLSRRTINVIYHLPFHDIGIDKIHRSKSLQNRFNMTIFSQ